MNKEAIHGKHYPTVKDITEISNLPHGTSRNLISEVTRILVAPQTTRIIPYRIPFYQGSHFFSLTSCAFEPFHLLHSNVLYFLHVYERVVYLMIIFNFVCPNKKIEQFRRPKRRSNMMPLSAPARTHTNGLARIEDG